MKNNKFIIIIILMLVSGVGILLYPTVSNWVATHFRELEIVHYSETVEKMDPELVAAELEKAREYNDSLSGVNIKDPFVPGSGVVLPQGYTSILNIDGKMGYIKIPKIDVYLPIYHGTSEEVLKKGVGHLENTAFPIGGEGNHTVLTGHTGLPSAKLLTDLRELELGDVFYITVLDEVHEYAVDQILIVEPSETEELRPVSGEDYVTLVTCTPYAINSHRLFVRGTRIPLVDDEQVSEGGTIRWTNWRMVIIILSAILIIAVIIFILIRRRRGRDADVDGGMGDE